MKPFKLKFVKLQTQIIFFNNFNILQCHWVQKKRHRLWFSTKTCSCYSTKTYVNSAILILKLNLTFTYLR